MGQGQIVKKLRIQDLTPNYTNYMARLVVVAAFLTGTVAQTVFAQQRPDFSGEWVLNRMASSLAAQSAAVESGVVRIEHREPRFRFERRFVAKGTPVETSYEIATDGSEQTRADQGITSKARLEWQGMSLLLTVHITTPKGVVNNIVRYELLDGGRALRAVEDVQGAVPEHHNVWVFDRR